MKIKTDYSSAEFKERQSSFEFFCAQAYEYLMAVHNKCRARWRELFKVKRALKKQVQLNLDFIRKLAEWADWTPEKNRELFS